MSDDEDGADEWEFYPCLVDDRPASIFLNLRYEQTRPSPPVETLYWARIHMADAGDHGMGTPSEAEALHRLEDAFIAAATKYGLVYVGRLRNAGNWQLTFYGAPDHDDALNALARAKLGERQFEIGSKPDADWTYYREFLLPDAERRQWISDRRLVGVLQEHGDVLATPRRVDHWVYFETAASRQGFVEGAIREGFALESLLDDDASPPRFGAQVFRDDHVELDHIHAVVGTLLEIAEEHGGDYDGWETYVVKPPPN
ncbi:MAG TPA: DUF695 domain-containing protein [Kofleriaceae bacterium]|jgi:hypothetical protein